MVFAPRLTIHRPWARGLIWLPEGAPRNPHEHIVLPGSITRYPPIEFAFTRGFTKRYANAGWATYERPFVVWTEANGYQLDYASQHDLHDDPDLLSGYRCVVFVGHDEYWTWEMREAVDRYVERAGMLSAAPGISTGKSGSRTAGELRSATSRTRMSAIPRQGAAIEAGSPPMGRPGGRMAGSKDVWPQLILWHVCSRRFAGGDEPRRIYRLPAGATHWALAGTATLGYGDILGGAAKVLGYEVDGLDYTFRERASRSRRSLTERRRVSKSSRWGLRSTRSSRRDAAGSALITMIRRRNSRASATVRTKPGTVKRRSVAAG